MNISDQTEIYITKCKPIPIIYQKNDKNPIEIQPIWLFIFNIVSNSTDLIKKQEKCRAKGRILNPIIGFDAETYEQIKDRFPSLVDFFKLYFEKSKFLVEITDKDIINIQLPPGNQLSFVKWLNFQPDFDYETFSSALFELSDEEFNEEKTAN